MVWRTVKRKTKMVSRRFTGKDLMTAIFSPPHRFRVFLARCGLVALLAGCGAPAPAAVTPGPAPTIRSSSEIELPLTAYRLTIDNLEVIQRGVYQQQVACAARYGVTTAPDPVDRAGLSDCMPDCVPCCCIRADRSRLLYRIEALEAGRLELLPDITFARGLAASICRHLGGDAAAVLACMPTSRHGLCSPASNAGYAPFHRASDRPASLLSHLFSRPVLIILALLALGAAALSLLPTLPIRLNAPAETTQDGTREDGAHAPVFGMVVEAVSEHSDSPLAAQPPL